MNIAGPRPAGGFYLACDLPCRGRRKKGRARRSLGERTNGSQTRARRAEFACMPASSCTLVFLEAGRPVRVQALRATSATLGRGPDCTVIVPHATVSRRHAEIAWDEGGARIRDLGGRNGVRVNGVPRGRRCCTTAI